MFSGSRAFPERNLLRLASRPEFLVRLNGFRTCSSCKVFNFALNFGAFVVFRVSVLGNLGMENSRLFAVSDGGDGGGGGYSGSDNGNFGGGGGDAGGRSSGNNWTLLSWYLAMLEKYPVITKAVTSALLTFFGDLISEGRPSEVVPKLQQEWFSAVLGNWKLWIPFQFLNFRFVQQQFQLLAANVIASILNVILLFMARKEIRPI